MHRSTSSLWKGRSAQLGLLAGAALTFVGGSEPPRLAAGPTRCTFEGQCTFKKPLLGFVLDDSTAMNQPFDADQTRWEKAIEVMTTVIEADNGYVADNFILALQRYGHDPDPDQPGTPIPGDTSGLVDGQKIDVPWYDPDDPDKSYIECTNGDAILATLAALPAPLGGADTGIGAWTHGAVTFARSSILAAFADHPQDMGHRDALLVVLTTGRWTDPTGALQLAPPAHDPTLAAADLYIQHDIPTFVVGLGGVGDQTLVGDLAVAGGTAMALPPGDPQVLLDALEAVIQSLDNDITKPVCSPGVGRVMILLDASSSMLNDGDARAAPGVGAWDQVRDKLAGDDAIFDLFVDPGLRADQAFHFGLSVFGSPDEQRLLVQYSPCRQPHIAWALDPASSCVAPGCVDPYAPPPLLWTSQDGSMQDPPGFGSPTFSHMPACDPDGMKPAACAGSGSFPGPALELVHANIDSARAACLDNPESLYPCSADTPFFNVLITDGGYDQPDDEVKDPLLAMHADGVITHVIGVGDAIDLDQLDKLAAWGSGDLLDPVLVADQDGLEAAFQAILQPPVFDPCCTFPDCGAFVDPDETTGEPPDDTSTSTGASESESESESSSTSTTAGGSSSSSTTAAASSSSSGSASSDESGGGTAPPDSQGDTTSGGCTDDCTSSATTGVVPTGDGPNVTSGPTGDASDTSGGVDERPSDAGCTCNGDAGPVSSLWLLGLLGLRRRRV